MIEINTPAMHMRIERSAAVALLHELRYTSPTGPVTEALYEAVRAGVDASEPAAPTAERLTWGPGKWIRMSSGDHVWRKRIVHAHAPAEAGPVLARIEPMGGWWEPWVYPHGEGPWPDMSKDVAVYPTEKTLRAAKAIAEREFALRRVVIEKDL